MKLIKTAAIILLLISLVIAISYYTSIKFNECSSNPLEYARQRVLESTTATSDDVSITMTIQGKYYIFDEGIIKPISEFSFNPKMD